MINYASQDDSTKKNLIEKMYVSEGKSFAQIAKELDSYANKIRRDAIKFDIKIRDKSEAQKNALQNGSHQHPTKGKARPESVKNKIGNSVMNSWSNLTSEELNSRKIKAKQNWDKIDPEQKEHMLSLANKAVRESSKTGSKLEKYLLSKLIEDNYKVDFHKEQSLLNTKLQIDLFLPTLNIAIEVDGPSHFQPVWGQDVLDRNKKYDNKKTGLLLGRGCVIIRVKQNYDFSKARAGIIYDKVKTQIKKIESNFPSQDNRIIEIGDDD
jgi:very-short-patch-repair endonuclease